MTTQQMHILIRIGIQELNNSVYSNMLEEELDALINVTIEEFISGKINEYKDKFDNDISKDAIRQIYNNLSNLLVTSLLPVSTTTDRYTEYVVPGNMFTYLSSSSISGTGCIVKTGSLKVDTYYRVSILGTTDLSNFTSTALAVGTVFRASNTNTPSWDGVTELEVVSYKKNRLVKFEEIDEHLVDYYLSSPTELICVISNSNLRVYKTKNTNIYDTELNYVRDPQVVSLNPLVNSDLNRATHQVIVSNVISKIAAYNRNLNYQQIKIENKESKENV